MIEDKRYIGLKAPKFASVNLIAFIVAACGGGGGGTGGSTPIPASNNAPMAGSDTSISLTEDVTALERLTYPHQRIPTGTH